MTEKKIFAAIEAIEAQMEATHVRRQRKQEELILQYLRDREPLLQRRYEIVTGRSEPTEEELQGFTPQGAAAAAAADAGSAGTAGGKGGRSGAARGVPFFWLNALCNQEEVAAHITARDRCALEYLEDVRYVRGPAGMQVEFHFADTNPYFTNKVLRKGVYVKRAAGGNAAGGLGPLAGVEEVREEATVIDWRPGRSLLVKAEPARGRAAAAAGKGKGDGGGAKQQGRGKKGAEKGGGKKGKNGGKAGGASAAPSRSKRQHGKHGGPAPDLPDPEEEEEEQEELAEEEEDVAVEEEGDSCRRRKPCPSFFRFFLPVTPGGHLNRSAELDPTQEDDPDHESEAEDEESEDEEPEAGESRGPGGDAASRRAARRAADSELLNVLVRKVVPRALHLYLAGGKGARSTSRGGAPDEGPEGDEEEEEEGYQLVSGSPAGDVGALALASQRAVHALRILQRRLDALASDFKAGEWQCQVAQAGEVSRLAAQRRTLLVGPAGATTGNLSIPGFWLRALRATAVGSGAVQHRDERALAALADVRLVWDTTRMPSPEEPKRHADLEFEFLPNPYFTNTVLRKRITFHAPGGSLNKLGVEAAQSDPIDWHPDRDLTLRLPPGGEGGRAGRPRAVPSFFAFFSNNPGALCRTFNIAGQSRAAQAEAAQAQEEFLSEVINGLVYFAGRMAASSPRVDLSDLGNEVEDDEEDESEEEDEAEEEGDEGGEDAATRRAARRSAAAAARAARRRGGPASDGAGGEGGGLYNMLVRLATGGGGGRGGVLMAVFVGIMLLAQVLVFLDTLDFVRARVKFSL